MGIAELIRGKRKQILKAAADHGARNVRVFGSVARNEAGGAAQENARSDLKGSDPHLNRVSNAKSLTA